MITTVVFDLDDTLYDEIDYCRSGFAAVAEALAASLGLTDHKRLFDAFWNQFLAGNHNTTFNAALEKLSIDYDEQLIRRLVKIYRDHHPSITLPAETRDVLDELSGKYTLALLTDGFLPAQQLKVAALRIEKYLKCIIYTEQLGRQFWKPSTVGFEKLIQTLSVEPQNCAYVADNAEKDFIAPNRLSFTTIQLKRPNQIHTAAPEQPDAKPRHIIRSLGRLPALLARL